MKRTYEKTHPWLKFQLNLGEIPGALWLLLGEARSKCQHLAGVPLRPETAREMHLVYLAKGVQGTTAIEGNTLSQEQIQDQIQGKLHLPPSKAYLQREVVNVLTALDMVWTHHVAQKITPLTLETIKEFNKMLLAGLTLPSDVEPGKVRRHSVGVATYRGAPAEDCEYLLGRLCEWLEELDAKAPPYMGTAMAMLRAILAHLYIAWIHPFGDGNGRTARLLEFAILSQAGVPTPAVHLLSNHYNQTRTEYYAQLDHSHKSGGNPMEFLRYAIQGFVDDLRAQLDLVRAQQLDVAWRNYVHELFKANVTPAMERCRNLVLDLSRAGEPVSRRALTNISPRVAAAYSGKTSKTLSRDVNVLRKMHLIAAVPGKGWRARTEIIEAFLASTAESPSRLLRHPVEEATPNVKRNAD